MHDSYETFAVYNLDTDERLKSSSGGLFSLFAKQTLSCGGVVYGVTMSIDCKKALVERVCDESNLEKLRGSKYVQADVRGAFTKVKADLEKNLFVLYSGTPCHINALKLFLGKNYENLLCVDVVCHGTPSPELWKKYVEHIERQRGKEIKTVDFRCKTNGWTDFGVNEINSNDEIYYSGKDENPYMQMFLKNYSLRPSCYECKVKDKYQSDITLGDFWGIDDVAPDMNDNKGISLLIIRTEKGKKIFEKIFERVIFKKVSYEDAVRGNGPVNQSVSKPKERETFFGDMNRMDMNELIRKYLSIPFKIKLKKKIKDIIKKMLVASGG